MRPSHRAGNLSAPCGITLIGLLFSIRILNFVLPPCCAPNSGGATIHAMSEASSVEHESGREPTRGPFCVACGFNLRGVASEGKCPECGSAYTAQSQYWMQAWPSVGTILGRLSWPLVLLLPALLSFMNDGRSSPLLGIAMLSGAIMILLTMLNGYFYARRLVKQCVPPWRRRSPRGRIFTAGGIILFFLTFAFALLPTFFLGWFGLACIFSPSAFS